ncbi:LysR family transcriptional regulator [Dyadobacter chenwenxiniae]|uniref:LysR family transcriptional regulator n=1 Tax=Dyadobacter chenwenxiniae TaxID=2906456 RepID=A0A9X1PQM3_9BACT|nr:LysR family transcriptional regulator [Dyadobacter chenwenxiniae]MCF0064715.1 LysR family transcriptional regulator [Dyadobacter chenwenxiniae]UON84231.1 LysR family transcriptional regulator [Dyadobacter chenwenxiniae]
MELRQLRYFLKARELLNFTEAARTLNISQSTLSQQIKQLEDELNVPLFNRIGKRITLTEAGNLFAQYALQSINKANEGLLLLQDLKNLNVGSITIGVIYSMRILFAKILVEFAKQYPKIKIQVVFGTTKDLLERLNLHQFDFILTFHEKPEGTELKYQSLLKANMVLVTAKKSPLAQRDNISLQEVADLPLALPFSGNNTIQFFEESFGQQNLVPNICMEINDIPTLFEIVKTGHWHTILSDTSVNDPEVVGIPIDGKNMRRTIMIISLREAYETKAVKKFYEMLGKM